MLFTFGSALMILGGVIVGVNAEAGDRLGCVPGFVLGTLGVILASIALGRL